MSDIAVVTLSCDKNAWLWRAWHQSYRNNWPWSLDWPMYLVTEHATPELENVTAVQGGGGTWSQNTFKAVQQIPHKHLLIMLDDFWPHPHEVLTREVWLELYGLFQQYIPDRLAVLGVAPRCDSMPKAYGETVATIAGVPVEDMVPEETPWFAALQAAIWVKEDFLQIIVPTESCWDFEPTGGRRLAALGRRRFSWKCDWYEHTVMSGHLHVRHVETVRALGDEPPKVCQ